MEQLEEKKKEEIKFIETDPQEPFPEMAVDAIKREMRKLARDLSVEYESAIQLLNTAMQNLHVPVPTANLKNRWEQYKRLIKASVEALADTRGFGAKWSMI